MVVTPVHKHLFVGLILLGSLIASRADLTLEQKADDGRHSRDLTVKIHGDRMRLDVKQGTNTMVIIVDLNSRDSLTLLPESKSFLKRTGTEIQQQMVARAQSGTNDLELDRPPAPAVNTGRREKVDGLDTELYAWYGAHHLTEILWVARDFPGYKSIQPELAKVDRYNDTGPHKNAQPELGRLPGMVVKTEITTARLTETNTLVSAKVEPVDASLFELPPDYTPWKPEPAPGTNTIKP